MHFNGITTQPISIVLHCLQSSWTRYKEYKGKAHFFDIACADQPVFNTVQWLTAAPALGAVSGPNCKLSLHLIKPNLNTKSKCLLSVQISISSINICIHISISEDTIYPTMYDLYRLLKILILKLFSTTSYSISGYYAHKSCWS